MVFSIFLGLIFHIPDFAFAAYDWCSPGLSLCSFALLTGVLDVVPLGSAGLTGKQRPSWLGGCVANGPALMVSLRKPQHRNSRKGAWACFPGILLATEVLEK